MNLIKTIIPKANDYSNPKYIGSKFRKKRLLFFEKRIAQLARPITILDIGGTVRFWTDENYHNKNVLITIVNLQTEKSNYPNIKVIKANASDLSMYKDKSYDIAFSNSLIEHLYTKENQKRMASEAMRVGKYYFIQTPNRYFPIEPHFKFPFFQFLPKALRIFLQTKTRFINGVRYNRAYAENIIKEIRLLSRKELESLFPGCSIYVEQFLGLSKSFVAYHLPDSNTILI
jgi:predicted SAM-dependent methyltransferase